MVSAVFTDWPQTSKLISSALRLHINHQFSPLHMFRVEGMKQVTGPVFCLYLNLHLGSHHRGTRVHTRPVRCVPPSPFNSLLP